MRKRYWSCKTLQHHSFCSAHISWAWQWIKENKWSRVLEKCDTFLQIPANSAVRARAVLTWHEIRTASSLIFSPSIILTRRLPLYPFSHLVASTLGLLERAKPNLCVLQQQKAIVRGHCESRAIYWTGNKTNTVPLVLLSSHSLCYEVILAEG